MDDGELRVTSVYFEVVVAKLGDGAAVPTPIIFL